MVTHSLDVWCDVPFDLELSVPEGFKTRRKMGQKKEVDQGNK